MRAFGIRLVAVALVAAACGGSTASSPFGDDAFLISASSDLGVGTDRLLLAVTTGTGARVASPDVDVSIRVFPDGLEDEAQQASGVFVWAIEGVSGLYRATFDFDRNGVWWVEVVPDGGKPLELLPINVFADPSTPAVGDPAPQSDSATLYDAPLAEITTDPTPNAAFYELSVAEAVTSGRPSVIVFATPKFCQTAICGPTLERIHEIAPTHPGVNFVHVEVFTNLDDPANLEPVAAVLEWGLPTEPWIFVVDETGTVVARFEGLVTAEELTAALG